MQIDLVRHGEIEAKNTYCGVTDYSLTEDGWQQMLKACARSNEWEKIITSPLRRCRIFAEHLSDEMNLPLHIDARWQEMNFGRWDGLSALEIMEFDEKKLQNFWVNPYQNCPPGGESLKLVQSRVLQAWQELVHEQKNGLVITHGGPMRIIHCHVENYPIGRLMNIPIPYAEVKSYKLPSLNTEPSV